MKTSPVSLPTGTVTFLFTDIEGSTRLWELDRVAMSAAVARHDAILRARIEANGGYVFKTVGDAFCATFNIALDALRAAVELQLDLAAEEWKVPGGIRVRTVLHTGTADERDGDYFGPSVNRTARLLSVGHGRQVLVSLVTGELLRDVLPDSVGLVDLGAHRLKDLLRPESVFQVVHPQLPREFPPLASLDVHPHNLPLAPTPFIGRQKELEAVRGLILCDSVRVLTLTGAGGTGKTRLALQAAADLIERFEDGVFFVDLSPVDEPSYLAPAIARTLGVHELAGRPLREGLRDFLRSRSLLLVIDNFEQLMAGAPLVAELLSACPRLKVIVTSRESLRLRGEQQFPVPPLSVPAAASIASEPPQRLSQYEAVALFIERAGAVRPDFAVTNVTAPMVAEICAKLDGLPLAIELAAARIAILTPEAILERLDNRLRLLTSDTPDLPPRQRTLRATIDWSYHLLGPAEQLLFRELSVFSGGATLAAMERVCACATEMDVLEALSALVAKSLVCQAERQGGVPGFAMMQSLREYGRELLVKSGTLTALRGAHAAYFLDLAERTEPLLRGPSEKEAFDALGADHDNLCAAADWLHGQGSYSDEARLCASLGLYWQVRGHFAEGRDRIRRLLEAANELPEAVRARLLLWAGNLAREQGDYDAAAAQLAEGRALALKAGDRGRYLEATNGLGSVQYRRKQYGAARRLFREVLADRSAEGSIQAAVAELYLGVCDFDEQRLGDARRHFEASERAFKAHGSDRLRALALIDLVGVALAERDWSKARALSREAREINERLENVPGLLICLNNLGFLNLRLREFGRARECYESLAAKARTAGNRRLLAFSHAGLAEALLSEGRAEDALEQARRGLQAAETTGSDQEIGVTLMSLGEAHLALGQREQARESLSRSIELLERAHDPEDLERAKQAYRHALEGQGSSMA